MFGHISDDLILINFTDQKQIIMARILEVIYLLDNVIFHFVCACMCVLYSHSMNPYIPEKM